jgi:glycogen synthase
VIAYGVGGAVETIVSANGSHQTAPGYATGLFFHQQTAEALMDAVRRFETLDFDPAAARANATRFNVAAFQTGIMSQVEKLRDRLPARERLAD